MRTFLTATEQTRPARRNVARRKMSLAKTESE